MAAPTLVGEERAWSAQGRVDDSALLYFLCESPFLFSFAAATFVIFLGPDALSVNDASEFYRIPMYFLLVAVPGIVLSVFFRSSEIKKRVVVRDSGLTQDLLWRDRVVPHSTVFIPAPQLFGLRIIGDEVQVVRRPGYDVPLVLTNEYFKEEASRTDFVESVRAIGGKVLFREGP